MGELSPITLVIVLAVAPLGLVLMYQHPQVAFLTFLVALVFPLSQLAWDTRPVAAAAVGVQLLRSTRLAGGASSSWSPRGQVGLTWLVALFAASTAWSLSQGRTVAAVGAWVVLLLAVHVFSQVLAREKLLSLVFAVVVGILVVSTLAIALGLGWATEGGRARGVLLNANGLGVLCCLAAPYFATTRLHLRRWLGLATVVFLLLMSASRAGALGTIAAVAAVVIVHGSALRRIGVTVGAVGAAVLVSVFDWGTYNQETGLLRTNNSREQVWAVQRAQFWDHPIIGTGFGTQNGLGSSYLKLAAELGVIGLIAAGLVLVGLLLGSRGSACALGVVVASLVNAVFEGWLLTAGSFYCVCFVLVATSAISSVRHVPIPELARS